MGSAAESAKIGGALGEAARAAELGATTTACASRRLRRRADFAVVDGAADTRAPRLRSATARDVQPLLMLWLLAGALPTATDDRASLERLLAHDTDSLILASVDERIVGSVIAGWDGWRGSIYRLVVHPDFRRAGLGRRLVEAAERRLTERGAVRLQAVAVASDLDALSFWRASGWSEQAARVRFVKG